MGVYIKGMEMPGNCYVCPFMFHQRRAPEVWCTAIENHWLDLREVPTCDRHKDCPLVPVPPHGRLIDADAPIKVWEVRLSDGDSCSFRNIKTTVSKFLLSHLMGEVPPTIIPAEEGE